MGMVLAEAGGQKTLLDLAALGNNTLVLAPPLTVVSPDPGNHRERDAVELSVAVYGNLTTLASKLNIEAYRTPLGDESKRDTVPAATTEVATDASGHDLGAELVVNGNFSAATGWTPNGWTIGSGVATLTGATGKSVLARGITDIVAGSYLHALTINTVGVVGRLRSFLTSSILPVNLALLPMVKGVEQGSPVVYRSVIHDVPLHAAAQAAQINIEGESGADSIVIDDVTLRQVTPYRQTVIYPWTTLGTGVTFGFRPAGNMTGAYISAWVRRLRDVP